MEDQDDDEVEFGGVEFIYVGPRRKKMSKFLIGFRAAEAETTSCCCNCHNLKEKAMAGFGYKLEKKKDKGKMTPKKMTKKLKEAR